MAQHPHKVKAPSNLRMPAKGFRPQIPTDYEVLSSCPQTKPASVCLILPRCTNDPQSDGKDERHPTARLCTTQGVAQSSLRCRPSPDCGLSTRSHLVLTETKYGPAKSRMTPVDVQMPIWPMMGKSHLQRERVKCQAESLPPKHSTVLPGAATQQTAWGRQAGLVHEAARR